MSFHDDLKRFGPECNESLSLDGAQAYCARLTATHYENFSVVTWLTPRELRPAFQSVYAFCRWSDDLGDEVGNRQKSRELLAWWRGELQAMFDGAPRHPVMIALAKTVREYAIPIEPFEALIAAFEQDQEVVEYDTYPQLLDYCTRSANPVGHLVLYLGRAFNEENAALSDATCTALQLANFWQDVSRDLDIPRIYLPAEDRARFGVSREQIVAKRFSREYADLLRFEVERTRDLFREGRPLVTRIPGKLAVDVDLFSRGGMAILDRIERAGFDTLTARPKLSKGAKVRLLLRALVGSALAGNRPAPIVRQAVAEEA
jgi:squalene synthase HpnC